MERASKTLMRDRMSTSVSVVSSIGNTCSMYVEKKKKKLEEAVVDVRGKGWEGGKPSNPFAAVCKSFAARSSNHLKRPFPLWNSPASACPASAIPVIPAETLTNGRGPPARGADLSALGASPQIEMLMLTISKSCLALFLKTSCPQSSTQSQVSLTILSELRY